MGSFERRVLGDGGWMCGNCEHWRIIKRHRDGDECAPYIEECPECGDEAFDVFGDDEKVP